jgi:hypothetical protein
MNQVAEAVVNVLDQLETNTSKIRGTYVATQNFRITDTTMHPHPYCIDSKHVIEASENWGGLLDRDAIIAAENKGARCGIKRCNLSFAEHEEVLIVHCLIPYSDGNFIVPELADMLRANKAEAENNRYTGFAFMMEGDV